MKKTVSLLLSLFLICQSLCGLGLMCSAEVLLDDEIASAILIESKTGQVLYEKDADLELIPASVTKVMTMLIIMEEIDSGRLALDDLVTTSKYAASMGGSQVYLKEGEQLTVNDMLKAITMASANDACVAMAEHISGSEEAFVAMMNKRANELSMTHTNFQNTNGLDDTVTEHYTSARDIVVMSRELINNHPKILEYTSVWMDTLRDGSFGLTNTNRLVRFYQGANGLKTGSTSKAGFCISASAEREGMQLICVIMKAPSRDIRNEAAKKLLDYGFANFTTVSFEADTISSQPVKCSQNDVSDFYIPSYYGVIPKSKAGKLDRKIILNDNIKAPLAAGDPVGTVQYISGEDTVYEDKIVASEDVKKVTYIGLVLRIFKKMLGA